MGEGGGRWLKRERLIIALAQMQGKPISTIPHLLPAYTIHVPGAVEDFISDEAMSILRP